MQEAVRCISWTWILLLGQSLACQPWFRYIPPASSAVERSCVDCTRSVQPRFFFGPPCCTVARDKNRLKNDTECGVKKDEKVVGGVETEENEIPWQVAVFWQNDTWLGCGAVLISCNPVIVLSAAHCFHRSTFGYDLKPEHIKLAFGLTTMVWGTFPLDRNEVRVEVEEIIMHPSYSRITLHAGISVRNNFNINVNTYENDIAIIKVKDGSLDCKKKTIWPACLPNENYEYGGWNRTLISGWGRVQHGGISSKVLKKATIPIVTDEQCTRNMFNISDEGILTGVAIADTKLCAGDIVTGQGLCEGDSGGPLVTQDLNSQGWSAVGIVSYYDSSAGCGGAKYGVFSEIGKYLPWIGTHFDMLPPE